jgi:hypothetical protein
VKYQHSIPNSSKDIAQVKDFSLRCDADADTGVTTIASRRAKKEQEYIWFRGGDINSFRDIQQFPVPMGWG